MSEAEWMELGAAVEKAWAVYREARDARDEEEDAWRDAREAAEEAREAVAAEERAQARAAKAAEAEVEAEAMLVETQKMLAASEALHTKADAMRERHERERAELKAWRAEQQCAGLGRRVAYATSRMQGRVASRCLARADACARRRAGRRILMSRLGEPDVLAPASLVPGAPEVVMGVAV